MRATGITEGKDEIQAGRTAVMTAFRMASVILVANVFFNPAVQAQTYPAKPIRLIIANTTGTSVDTLARVLAVKLGEELGQQVVSDNRAGAGGLIGAEIVANS